MADDKARLEIGGNSPPSPIEALVAQLTETHAPLMARCEQLMDLESRLPAEMDDDWEAKISDAIKSCTKFVRNSEVTRLDANEPHRALIAATDGFFKGLSDKVEGLKKKMTAQYLTPYQQQKADAVRRQREEEARQAKARANEEERQRRAEAARLAEIKRHEDAAKAAEARRAEEARQAEARAQEAKAAAARQAAEAVNKKQRDAAAAAQKKADDEAAEIRRKADEDRATAQAEQDRLAAERAEQERITREARDKVTAAREEQDTARMASTVKAAELSRTRSGTGSVASLRTVWKHEVVDEQAVPRLYLRVHEPSIVAAIRAATTDDGKCPLTIDGVRIYPDTSSVVR